MTRNFLITGCPYSLARPLVENAFLVLSSKFRLLHRTIVSALPCRKYLSKVYSRCITFFAVKWVFNTLGQYKKFTVIYAASSKLTQPVTVSEFPICNHYYAMEDLQQQIMYDSSVKILRCVFQSSCFLY